MQGNVRYNANNIQSRNQGTLNLYDTDKYEFQYDPSITSKERFQEYKKTISGVALNRVNEEIKAAA